MPRVRPATITLRDGTILKEGKDQIELAKDMINVFTVEIQEVDEKLPKKWYEWNVTTTKKVMKQVRIPIMSYPYSQVKSIDWGYIPKEQYDKVMSELAKAKQAEDATKKGHSDERLGTDKGTTKGSSDK